MIVPVPEASLLKHKSENFEKLIVFFITNPTVRKIRCNNIKEYLYKGTINFNIDIHIMIDFAPPYTSPLNGVAERCNRILGYRTGFDY